MNDRVVVGVCTYRRPVQLAVLLDRVLTSTSSDVVALVVDDSPEASAVSVVADATARFPERVHHRHTGSSDIATARNAVLDGAIRLGAWLVLVDDDCLPEPDWLDRLRDVQRRTGADVVTGHRRYTTPPGAPRWLTDEPFCHHASYPDCSEPIVGNTCNVLVSTAWLQRSGVRFRAALGRTGGEDMAFIDDARRSGAVLRHSARSIVTETFLPHRLTLRAQLWLHLWLGNNEAVIDANRDDPLPRSRLALRGLRRVVTAPAAATGSSNAATSIAWRWALARVASGLGLVLGSAGVHLRHRV